jgi:hypothetical protein
MEKGVEPDGLRLPFGRFTFDLIIGVCDVGLAAMTGTTVHAIIMN